MDVTIEEGATAAMEARVVRYGDLRPCLNAFIDSRSPGSERKENFTIIGPGVSENPAQHVHIPQAHGFNIGGARQPPGCLNSQHSHQTAETIVVHTGQWRFDFGETGQDVQVLAGPGDVLSVPTRMFRGFTNVGEQTGFLFFVLGSDDPGRVTWAPNVFEMARDYGLVLAEDGSLIDTAAGETLPEGRAPMPPTTPGDVARLRVPTRAEIEAVIVRSRVGAGAGEYTVIGPGAPLDWPHGFTLSHLVLAEGTATATQRRDVPEVVFVQSGVVQVRWDGGMVTLHAGDTATVPTGAMRSLAASDGMAEVFAVRGEAAG